MEFNYYYGSQADQFSFIRIPKNMLTGDTFTSLSLQAKVLYGVLLDRMALSQKNKWLDSENRVYIIYQVGEIQEDLGLSKKKALDLLSELESFGLLEKKRRGHGLPNILYIKSFLAVNDTRGSDFDTSGLSRSDEKSISQTRERTVIKQSGQEVRNSALQEVPKPVLQEVSISAPLKNKTELNKTNVSDIESNLIVSGNPDTMRWDKNSSQQAEAYRKIILENIAYDDLLISQPEDRSVIDGIVDLILEVVLSQDEYILIASNRYPSAMVRGKLLKLKYNHIVYVLHSLKKNTRKVKNVRKYLLAALFNAPTTMDVYYQAEVNHDMAEYAVNH